MAVQNAHIICMLYYKQHEYVAGTLSVANPDPGSGIGFFRIPDLGSRISDPGPRIPDLGSQTHIFENLVTIF
jgi:hypothetical protein